MKFRKVTPLRSKESPLTNTLTAEVYAAIVGEHDLDWLFIYEAWIDTYGELEKIHRIVRISHDPSRGDILRGMMKSQGEEITDTEIEQLKKQGYQLTERLTLVHELFLTPY